MPGIVALMGFYLAQGPVRSFFQSDVVLGLREIVNHVLWALPLCRWGFTLMIVPL